jgi:hypothetical protein
MTDYTYHTDMDVHYYVWGDVSSSHVSYRMTYYTDYTDKDVHCYVCVDSPGKEMWKTLCRSTHETMSL